MVLQANQGVPGLRVDEHDVVLLGRMKNSEIKRKVIKRSKVSVCYYGVVTNSTVGIIGGCNSELVFGFIKT